MIAEKIKRDIAEEFANLKRSLEVNFLSDDFDVSETKKFLKTYIPKEVRHISKILLDTLVNYLMEDAINKIKLVDPEVQNKFFDANFRKRIRELVKQVENQLELEQNIIRYTLDPRLKQGLIAGSITAVAGAAVTITLIPTVVAAIVSGIFTILLSVIAFKIAYDMATPKAREMVKRDIDKYLSTVQKQVEEWLNRVEEAFKKDFGNFCEAEGIKC